MGDQIDWRISMDFLLFSPVTGVRSKTWAADWSEGETGVVAALLWDFFLGAANLAPGPISRPNNIDMRLLSTDHKKALQ